MRALRSRPGPPDTGPSWEAFVLDAVREVPLPDLWLYGEPYPTLNAVILEPEEHASLVALTERFATIFHKAVRALQRDAGALQRLGFPWVALELLDREAPDEPFILGRFDFALDAGGAWQVLEYNADTPSGTRETVALERVVLRHLNGRSLRAPEGQRGSAGLAGLEELAGLEGTARLLGGAVRRAFARALEGLPEGATLGIVTDAGYAEDLSQAVFLHRHLAPALARRGLRTRYADVDNLSLSRGRLHLLGHPLDALYRYYPFETLLGQQAFVDLFAAVGGGRLRLLNGWRGLLAQNKGLLAWLWAHRADTALFSAPERRTIEAHLPPVWWIDEVPPGERREALVLKQAFGREGEEVYFGDRLSDADWARCLEWGSYVCQRRVAVPPLVAAVSTASGAETQTLWPAVGSFTARGRWAGYYTRLGAPITDASARYVPTLVHAPRRDPRLSIMPRRGDVR
jgi:glutathionylspermidine synthase